MAVQINGDTGNVSATKADFSGNISIGGTLTYEDVTNVDSVGLITARTGIEIGARPGVGASISVDGNAIFSGITTVGTQLNIDTASSTEMIVLDVSGTNFARIGQNSAGGTNILDVRSEGHMRLLTGGNNERLRIDSSGRVGINETSMSSFNSIADDLVISQSSGSAGVTIRTSTTGSGTLAFTDAADTTFEGDIRYVHDGDYMRFSTAGNERARINSSGHFGIGSGSNTNKPLHIYTGSSDAEIRLQTNSGTEQNSYMSLRQSNGDLDFYTVQSGTSMKFHTANTERVKINGDGIMTKPYQPYFYANAGTNRDNVTDQVLAFSSAVRNNGSHYDTSNSRFTAPVTGAYIFGGTPAYQETSDTMSIQIRKNGTTVFEVERVVAGSMNQHSAFGFSTMIYLSASDYVDLYVSGQCHQNGSYSHWFGYLLG
jgi:hypothetical protein